MSTPAAKFVWYELMTSDRQAAQAFYQKVIGWTASDAGIPGMPYTLFSAGPSMVAGLMTLPEEASAKGAKPGWLGYVGVSDVDALAARVQAAGGAIHQPPQDIPGVGRFAVVADPHGAAFALFKGNGEPDQEPPPPSTPGTIGWHELHAGDGAAAFEFYAALFGWTKTDALDMGAMGVYQLFATGAAATGGMMTKTAEMPMAAWLYYINVAAIDDAIARVTGAGGTVINGPMEVPGGSWIVQCLDPQGAMFALVAPQR